MAEKKVVVRQTEPLIKSRFFSSKTTQPINIEYENEDKEQEKNIYIDEPKEKKKLTTTTTTTTSTTPTTKPSNNVGTKRKLNEMKSSEISLAKINWEDVWSKISKHRDEIQAPVDWAGAEVFNDTQFSDKDRRFHVLVGCLLSSQTRDQVTHSAMGKLKAHGLTVDNVLKTDDKTLNELIHPVSFYQRKVGYLKSIAKILKEKYQGDIPSTYSELTSLPGLGPKMTLLILLIAWKKVEGIAIDVHMHRICNRLGWVKSKTPEETRKQLESWLPKEKWSEINHLLVGFGQTICQPLRPKCKDCYVNNLCPTGIQNLSGEDKDDKDNEEEEEEKVVKGKKKSKPTKKKN